MSNAQVNSPAGATAANIPQGGGQPLPQGLRTQLETQLGQDFSGVRIHTDVNAIAAARQMDAQAYTTGNDIYFNAGQYAPGSPGTQRLLAHELAHVVQQDRGPSSTNP